MSRPIPAGAIKAIKILQLVVSFIAVLLAAFCAVCFAAVLAYSAVWWSVWVLVLCHELAKTYLLTGIECSSSGHLLSPSFDGGARISSAQSKDKRSMLLVN